MEPTIKVNGVECYGDFSSYVESVVVVTEFPDGTEVQYDARNDAYWATWTECVMWVQEDFETQELGEVVQAIYTEDMV